MYKQYEAFENAEEVWLWYCACLEARREGLAFPRGLSGAGATLRNQRH